MRIFLIGDIVGNGGVEYLRTHLGSIKKLKNIDFVVANAENSTPVGKGISKEVANTLYSCGVDVMTMGNHTFNNKEIYELFEDNFPVIRPANMPPMTEGEGYVISEANGYKIAVISLLGRVFMENMDCPFRTADKIIDIVKDKSDIIIVDIHAEATSEKLAMGYYLDGKVSVVFGTHTHVQTADEKILENGTAYITDVGMTGCHDGVLGVKKEIIIKKFLTSLPQRHETVNENPTLNGLIVDVDESTGKATNVERIQFA